MSSAYEILLDKIEELRNGFRQSLADRTAGESIFIAPPGFTLEEWVGTLEGEVERLTDILNKAGRQ